MSSTQDQRPGEEKEKAGAEAGPGSPTSGTYECGCHCGFVKFAMTLSPPLPEYEVMQCNCSACTRFGYLLVCTSRPFPVAFLVPHGEEEGEGLSPLRSPLLWRVWGEEGREREREREIVTSRTPMFGGLTPRVTQTRGHHRSSGTTTGVSAVPSTASTPRRRTSSSAPNVAPVWLSTSGTCSSHTSTASA